MCAQAGLHANDARWQLLEHIFETRAPDLPAKRDCPIGAQANEVKNFLANVDTNYRPVMPWSSSLASSLLLLFIAASR